jgi:hypothetical protein
LLRICRVITAYLLHIYRVFWHVFTTYFLRIFCEMTTYLPHISGNLSRIYREFAA